MGSNGNNPINSIANNVSNVGQNINKGFNNTSQYVNDRSGGVLMPITQGGWINKAINPDKPDQPSAPGVDPGLSATLQSQQQQAQQFRSNLPQNEQGAYSNLTTATNHQLGQNMKAQNASDNSRGLLYGGLNQGHQQQQRLNASNQLAQGRENINDQYQNAANQMDAAAISTGQMVQQSQQAIQDQIYQQALMNMQNQNRAFGSLAQAGGTGIGMALA